MKKWRSVIGREEDGMFVLFDLGDGVVAVVEKRGNVQLRLGWASMTQNTNIDPRGEECVPEEELVPAKAALEAKWNDKEIIEWKRYAAEKEEDVEWNEWYEAKYKKDVEKMPRNPDGSIAWP